MWKLTDADAEKGFTENIQEHGILFDTVTLTKLQTIITSASNEAVTIPGVPTILILKFQLPQVTNWTPGLFN